MKIICILLLITIIVMQQAAFGVPQQPVSPNQPPAVTPKPEKAGKPEKPSDEMEDIEIMVAE